MPRALDAVPPKHYRLVIVTTELHPFTRGGIGVLYANLLLTYASDTDPILILNASAQTMDPSVARRLYPHSDLVNGMDVVRTSAVLSQDSFATTADWHYRGYLAHQALLRLERQGVTWDTLEFQDFGGLATPTLLGRFASQQLTTSEIAVRVHGPEAVLRRHSPRAVWPAHAVVMDLERLALRHADRLVAHGPMLAPVLEEVFELEGLADKTTVQRPPIGQSNGVSRPRRQPQRAKQVVFASKLDAIKAPEIFLRAAAILLERRPDVDVVVMADRLEGSHDASSGLLATLEAAGRMRWLPALSQAERRSMLSESCVVVAGSFEAFCLLAYEAAILGGRPVLSSRNPAFGAQSVWRDAENCWSFDGTSHDLAAVLERHVDEPLASPLVWEHDVEPYWLEGSQTRTPRQPASLSVGVVVTNKDLEEFADECVQSLRDQQTPPDVVVLVDDGSRDPDSLAEAERGLLASGIKVVRLRNEVARGLGAARNQGLRELSTDLVCFLDVDDILDPRFLSRGAATLARSDSAAVVPFVACVNSQADFLVGLTDHVLPFLGATLFTRYHRNLMSSATSLVRRSVLGPAPFDEHLTMYEDWDLWCRLAERGETFLVDSQIGLWYRQRPTGMATVARGTVEAVYAADRLRTNALKRGAGRVQATALTDFGATAVVPSAVQEGPPTLDDAVRAEIARLQSVERNDSVVLGRKAVRAAIRLADLKHGLRRRGAGGSSTPA